MDKYIKYKQKYLKQRAGAICACNNLSHNFSQNKYIIYATGMADLRIYQFWKVKYCKIICDLIPPNFTIIQIILCDPLDSFLINKNESEKEIIKSLDERIKYVEFTNIKLNYQKIIELNIPYMILDFAHVFYYTGNLNYKNTMGSTEVQISGIYEEKNRGEIFTLNIFYPGYIGDDINDNKYNRILVDYSNIMIKIYENGYFSSIIHKLSKFKNFNSTHPLKMIYDIYIYIKDSILLKKFRTKYESYSNPNKSLADRFDYYIEQEDLTKYILDNVINQIMNDKNIIQIYKFFNDLEISDGYY